MSGWEDLQRIRRRYLQYAHLPPRLQTISRPCCELIDALIGAASAFENVDWVEFAKGAELLVQAKDAFVRAVVPEPGGEK